MGAGGHDANENFDGLIGDGMNALSSESWQQLKTESFKNAAITIGLSVLGARILPRASAGRSVGAIQKANQTAATQIANGHAFPKHAAEFGFTSRTQMANHISRVMNNPSAVRNLQRGRTAYWDNATQSVVIRNPAAKDGGTAFVPKAGRTYFEKLD